MLGTSGTGAAIDTAEIRETLYRLLVVGLSPESAEAAASALVVITVGIPVYFKTLLDAPPDAGVVADGDNDLSWSCRVSVCWGLLTVSSAHAMLVEPLEGTSSAFFGLPSSSAAAAASAAANAPARPSPAAAAAAAPRSHCLLEVVLGTLLEALRSPVTAAERAAAIKAIVVWTTVVCNADRQGYTPTLTVVDALVDWVWSWWDDAIDRIKHQVFRLFEGTLAVHKCIVAQQLSGAADGGGGGGGGGGGPPLSGRLSRAEVEKHALAWRLSITARVLASIKAGNRGAFGCCVILVEQFGQQALLDLAPSLPSMLLEMFEYDQSTATATASVVDAMLKDAAGAAGEAGAGGDSNAGRSSQPGSAGVEGGIVDAGPQRAQAGENGRPWRTVWLPLLAASLQSASGLLRKRLAQLVLPKLFDAVAAAPRQLLAAQLVTAASASSAPAGLPSSSTAAMGFAQLAGLVTTLKVANTAKKPAPFGDAVPDAMLVNAVLHADENLRLDTLTLLCTAKRATLPIPLATFNAIAWGFSHNMVGQTAAFRHDLVDIARKLHARLLASARHCFKEQQQREQRQQRGGSGEEGQASSRANQPKSSRKVKAEAMLAGVDPSEYVRAVAQFVEWFRGLLFASLSLDLSQQRRLTALELLRVYAATYSTPLAVSDAGLPAMVRLEASTMTMHERALLIGTLSDPYEANRHVTLRLLEEAGMDMVALMSLTISIPYISGEYVRFL